MTSARAVQPPVVLMADSEERPLESVLQGMPHEVYHVHTGRLAIDCAPSLRPDVIMLAANLEDMSGIEAAAVLHAIPVIGHHVPILILAPEPPTPEQRVAALEAGAWDFARYPSELAELSLKVQAYVQAKRNIDVALAETRGEPEAVVHPRSTLARRARELGALLTRVRASLACVVFVIEGEPAEASAAAVIARAARLSDIVGTLRPSEVVVVAPATDEAGAVRLAQRLSAAVQGSLSRGGQKTAPMNVGYDAIANLGYRPIDPVALVARASAAARIGRPEPGHVWLRRYDDSAAWRGPQGAGAVLTGPSTEGSSTS